MTYTETDKTGKVTKKDLWEYMKENKVANKYSLI